MPGIKKIGIMKLKYLYTIIIYLLWIANMQAQVDVDIEHATCAGEKDGKITVSVGIAGDFTYRLSLKGPQTSPIFDNLDPGRYTLVVEDRETECGYFQTVIVKGNLELSFAGIDEEEGIIPPERSIGGIERVVCEGSESTVNLTAIAGKCTDCTFNWSNGETGSTIEIAKTGSYSVTATNSTGCTNARKVTVFISNVDCDNDDDSNNPGGGPPCDSCSTPPPNPSPNPSPGCCPGPWRIPRLHAVDPNDITGPTGYETDQWVSINDKLGYTIRFENDPAFATAPAQVVRITTPIDEALNPLSFRLGDFGFGDFLFQVPPNSSFYTKRLDVIDSLGVYVDITAGIDVKENQAFWIFESIDPITNLPPEDALKGFLPVNDTTVTIYTDTTTQKGEGFVNYSIYPAEIAETGDTILAQASIIFDVNDAIATNTWSNKVDALPPTSNITNVTKLNETIFKVDWSGDDDDGGVGLDNYDLYISVNGGAYSLFVENLDTTALSIQGVKGNAYSFYTRAIDFVGNEEAPKSLITNRLFIGEPDSIAIHQPMVTTVSCNEQTLIVDWSVFGEMETVDIRLSTDGGATFPMLIAQTASTDIAPIVYDLPTSLAQGNNFVIQIKDSQSNGTAVTTSAPFIIGKSSLTELNKLTCEVAEVGLTYDTLSNRFGCDSLIATTKILDNIAPTIDCKANITLQIDASGTVALNTSLVDNGSSDNCEIATRSLSKTSFTCQDIGSQQITFTVIDKAGNKASCPIQVEIVDNNSNCGCQDTDLIVDTISKDRYVAKTSITSSAIIAATNDVSFIAGNTITLKSGFHAKQQSKFLATIQDCVAPTNLGKFPPTNIAIKQFNTNAVNNPIIQIIPNPFKNNTTVRITLKEAGLLDIRVNGIAGNTIKILSRQQHFEAGIHDLFFDAANNPSGMYYLVVASGTTQLVEKLILVR